jgi:hypothetical protein
VSGDPNTLYQCTAGNLTVSQVCPNGCQVMPPGINDQCAAPSPTCPSGNGLYCGGDGVSGDPNTLYQCTAGNLTVSQVCPSGCQVMPAGVNDQCRANANCAGQVDGLYCGNDGLSGDPNTLFRCTGGNASVAQVCANGCQVNPPGINDQCR